MLFIVFSPISFPGGDDVRHRKDHFASGQKGTYRKIARSHFVNESKASSLCFCVFVSEYALSFFAPLFYE